MEHDDFSFMDLTQFGHHEQLSDNVEPSIIQHPPTSMMVSHLFYLRRHLCQDIQPLQPMHSGPTGPTVPVLTSAKIGKRQTNRQKYTDDEVARICSMKEAGMPWRFSSFSSQLNTTCSKIAAHFPGRSQKSLQVSYCVNFKKRTEKFDQADVSTCGTRDRLTANRKNRWKP